MNFQVNMPQLVNKVVLKVARMMIECDCNALSKTSSSFLITGMHIPPKEVAVNAEWNKKVDCVKLIQLYLSDSDESDESEGDYGEEVAALTAKYIKLAEEKVIRSLVGLAFPIEAEDKVE